MSLVACAHCAALFMASKVMPGKDHHRRRLAGKSECSGNQAAAQKLRPPNESQRAGPAKRHERQVWSIAGRLRRKTMVAMAKRWSSNGDWAAGMSWWVCGSGGGGGGSQPSRESTGGCGMPLCGHLLPPQPIFREDGTGHHIPHSAGLCPAGWDMFLA